MRMACFFLCAMLMGARSGAAFQQGGEAIATFPVSLSENGRYVAVVECGDYRVAVLSTGFGSILWEHTFPHRVYLAKFTPDNSKLVVIGQHGILDIVDWSEQDVDIETTIYETEPNEAIAARAYENSHMGLSSDGSRMAYAAADWQVVVVNLDGDIAPLGFEVEHNAVAALTFVGNRADQLLVLSHKIQQFQSVYVLQLYEETASGWARTKTVNLYEYGAVGDGFFSRDGRRLLCRCTDPQKMMLVSYDIAADHDELRATPAGEPFGTDVTSFTETEDGRTVVFSRVLPPDLGIPIRGMVYFYSTESDEEWAVRTTTGPRPWSMTTSPSGDAIVSDDLGNVYCFSTRTADVQWVTHLVEPEE